MDIIGRSDMLINSRSERVNLPVQGTCSKFMSVNGLLG